MSLALLGIGAGVLGGMLGNKSSNDAADSAADAQRYAADQAAALQKYMYDTSRGDMMPYMNVGTDALYQAFGYTPQTQT